MRERRSPVPRQPRSDGPRPDKHRASVDSNTLEEQCHPRKIFIGGLAHKTTTQHLREHFGRFGPIVDAVVLRWPDGRSRGFGYVTFSDVQSAASVLQENHQLSGREVDVKRAVPGTNKLFIGGLPQNTTANELREHFEKFGVVSDAVVMIDPATSRSRGFGFVCYLPGQEGATAVGDALKQYENHRIRGKWIEVKSAAPPHKLAAKGGAGGQDGDLLLSEIGANMTSTKESCELSLAGALQCSENREQNCQGGDMPRLLGSPRKVSLSSATAASAPSHAAGPRHAMQSPPPGLESSCMPMNGYADLDSNPMGLPGALPWWPASPWQAPYPASAAGLGHLPMNNPPPVPQSGITVSESLQRNLEEFLRQSLHHKMESVGAGHKGTPSVSTTCSGTQTEVGATYTAEI